MKFILFFFTFLSSVNGTHDKLQRKRISDDNYNYVFYVTDKKVANHNLEKEYHYFKSGEIHISRGGANGQLLHGDFEKTYISNALAEKGTFTNGLKNKSWRSWYENGKLKEVIQWNNGYKSGPYQQYDDHGKLFLTGKYRANKKQGMWIAMTTKDTLYFDKGVQVDMKALAVEKERKKLEKNGGKEKKNFKEFWTETKGNIKEFFRKKSPEEKEKIAKEKEAEKKEKLKALENKRKALEAKQKALETKKTTTSKKKSTQKATQKK